MRKYLIPVAAAAIALTSTISLASEDKENMVGMVSVTEGTVGSWDARALRLTLANGTMYFLTPSMAKTADFTKGEVVKITYKVRGFDDFLVQQVTPVTDMN